MYLLYTTEHGWEMTGYPTETAALAAATRLIQLSGYRDLQIQVRYLSIVNVEGNVTTDFITDITKE